jgi:hypothetical protein
LPQCCDAAIFLQTKAYALQRVTQQLHAFPGYARIRKIALLGDP